MAKKYDALYGSRKTNSASGGTCLVPERCFPEIETCCRLKTSDGNAAYEARCPNCGIWSSLPDGGNLSVSHIFECALYGYGKRLKEK